MNLISGSIGALLAVGGAYLAFVQRKKHKAVATELKYMKSVSPKELMALWRTVADQNIGGSYRDFVETTGQAATEGNLHSPYGHFPCAYYVATVAREYEKDETTTDSAGKTSHRTVRASEMVSSQKSPSPLFLVDGPVRIGIDLDGASVDFKDGADRFEPYEEHRTYSFFGMPFSMPSASRTLGFRYKEQIIPDGHPLYVVGEVRSFGETLRVGRPSEGGKPFIVSVKSEEEVTQGRLQWAKAQLYLGGAMMISGVIIAIFL